MMWRSSFGPSVAAVKTILNIVWLLLCGLWFAIFFASLFTPPVLDDADGTHANAARQMALSGD